MSDTLPLMDFSGLIVSMHASALMYLGAMETPEGQTIHDVDLARQSIDMLRVIDEKTRGNLTEDEEKLMKKLLFDLHLAFVRATEGAGE
jgi:hypothetical protein